MNKINTEISAGDRSSAMGRTPESIAAEILEDLKLALPFSTTFIEEIPMEKRAEVEAKLKYMFTLWANSWIAPKCRQIIAK